MRPLPDEAVRRRLRSELSTTFLVEAGAGTGKTTVLVDRVEALVRQGARLRDIVAITFTEKAAAELRIKIRERIERALAKTQSAEERGRFWAAFADLELAPISTIHAFAAELLHERPVEAGVDPGFTVADELNASLFRTEAWDRWLEAQRDDARGALGEAIEFGLDLTRLREVGDALLRYRDVATAEIDRGPQPPDPVEWLRRVELELRGFVARVASDCRLAGVDRGAADLVALQQELDILARLGDGESRRRILTDWKLTLRGNQQNWKAGVLARMKSRMRVLGDELDELRAAWGHWLAAGIAGWLRGYVETYQDLKRREGVLDFDDLLLIARDLLRDHRDARADFQARFSAILVDEFQDTDPLQAEIIFFLAEDGAVAETWDQVRQIPGKLFIVGDPKQSIYAFRRADIETYERAKDVVGRNGKIEYITANFRSVGPILGAVNDLFGATMHTPPDGAYQPEYVPLEPSTTTREPDGPPLIMLHSDAPQGEKVSMHGLREREAEGLAAFLRESIENVRWNVRDGDRMRHAEYRDLALLFRGMTDVPIYEEALVRYGIPYRVTSSRTFYKREEVGWLLNVLHAIEHPTDAIAVWGALRSPFFGCSEREIYQFVVPGGSLDYRDPLPWASASEVAGGAGSDTSRAGNRIPLIDSLDHALQVLRGLHADRHRLSVPQMVDEVLARTHGRITFLLTLQGEQRVANLDKVVALARALEESGILTFRAFVHWLRDMEEQAVDEAESPTVEETDNVVRIMSIHAAKGLEFPIVVIPDLSRRAGGRGYRLLLHRLTGQMAVSLGKTGQWLIQTRNGDHLGQAQDARETAERLRVLYVATTRAKEALVLPLMPGVSDGFMPDLGRILPQNPQAVQTHKSWLQLSAADAPRLAAEPSSVRLRLPSDEAPEENAERRAWEVTRQTVQQASGQAEAVVNPARLVDHEALTRLKQEQTRLELEPGGRRLGDLVHRALSMIPPGRTELVVAVVKYIAQKGNAGQRLMKRAEAMVLQALAAELGVEVGQTAWREVPFVLDDGAQVTEGSMDLLTADEQRLTISEYKTDAVSANQLQALEELYAPQLERYADVVRRAGATRVETRLIHLGRS